VWLTGRGGKDERKETQRTSCGARRGRGRDDTRLALAARVDKMVPEGGREAGREREGGRGEEGGKERGDK
jgi:hypothetical protein